MAVLTERLILTPIGPEHTANLVQLHADPKVAYWNAGAWSEAEARRFAVEMRRRWSLDQVGKWIAHRRSDGALVGRGGLSLAVVDGQRRPELGWAVRDEMRGQGFATEIGAAGLRFGFDVLGVHEVVAFTEAHNHASRAVMERLDMWFVTIIYHQAWSKARVTCRTLRPSPSTRSIAASTKITSCEDFRIMTCEVSTSAGTVRGCWEDGVAVCRGIPFAAPPVGPRRFAAPLPAEPWEGVRDASRFGPPPPQPARATEGDDWLNLAVWTLDPGRAALPVVVWISGGGYLKCDSADPYLTGAAVAAAGAVVVSANYRSGFEGFAHLDSAPDNRALLDQLAALRWVQDNIAGFGGDPDNVTVLGQSAGAGSIAALLTMPTATGLFRRAILQSIPETYFTTDLAAEIAAEICGELGRLPRVSDLAAVSPGDLVEASRTVTSSLVQRFDRWGSVAYSSTPFAPVVDGDVLPSAPWAALADGAARDVELLIGHTRDEYSLLAAQLPHIADAPVNVLIDGLSPTPGADRYRAAYPWATAEQLRETALSDWLYRMPALHLAEAADLGGARVWLYELSWGFGPYGASHGLDTLLLFGTADLDGEVTTAGPAAIAAAGQLSQLIRAEHLAFAATGDPGWAQFRTPQRMTRVYCPDAVLTAYPEERSRALWTDQQFGVLSADRRC